MNKRNLSISFFVIIIVLTGNIFAQVRQSPQFNCGSSLDFEEMQRSDSVRYKRFMDYERLLQTQLLNTRSIPSGVITIPVVVHIVYNTNEQNISDAQIDSQLQVLNQDFRRLNADRVNTPFVWQTIAADAEFEFKLAKIDPNGNPTTGITRTPTSVTAFSDKLNNVKYTNTGGCDAWDAQRYLNIWVCHFSDPTLGGYSSFPADLAAHPDRDGVAISYKYFGVGGHTLPPYNKGRKLTHEVGHWLDVYHLWGNVFVGLPCSSYNDYVGDTPPQSKPTYGCGHFPLYDPCYPYNGYSTNLGIMCMNYMDYTDDACMNLFTNGQKARMRALFDEQVGLRKNMLGHCLVYPLVVNFTNQTVNSDTTVKSCGDINVQDVNVTNNAKLKLDAPNVITIDANFSVPIGSQLQIK